MERGLIRKRLLENRFTAFLIPVNVLGTVFGIYYYLPQLASTDIIFWPVIPDSPTATLLFAVSVYIISTGKGSREKLWNIVHSLAFIGNAKYGLWTVYVLLNFMPEFTSMHSTPMYVFLIISHLGMFLQSLLLLPYIQPHIENMLAPLIYILNDFIDYSFQVHTTLPEAQPLNSSTGLTAVTLTVITGLSILFSGKIQRYRYLD